MKYLLVITLFIFTSGHFFGFYSQEKTKENNTTYSNWKIKLDYPSDWKFKQSEVDKVQYIDLISKDGSSFISILSHRDKTDEYSEFNQLRKTIAQPNITKLSKTFSANKIENVCSKFGKKMIPGFRISGTSNTVDSTIDVFIFSLNEKFLTFLYKRENNVASRTDTAWDLIRKTLEAGKKKSNEENVFLLDFDNNSVLNDRAIELPPPINVPFRSHGYTEIFKVRVKVDKEGNVTYARAITNFGAVFAQAARKAKFKPMIVCGEPTEYEGIVTYNFK